MCKLYSGNCSCYEHYAKQYDFSCTSQYVQKNLPSCGGLDAHDPDVCSGHGECQSEENCECSGVLYLPEYNCEFVGSAYFVKYLPNVIFVEHHFELLLFIFFFIFLCFVLIILICYCVRARHTVHKEMEQLQNILDSKKKIQECYIFLKEIYKKLFLLDPEGKKDNSVLIEPEKIKEYEKEILYSENSDQFVNIGILMNLFFKIFSFDVFKKFFVDYNVEDVENSCFLILDNLETELKQIDVDDDEIRNHLKEIEKKFISIQRVVELKNKEIGNFEILYTKFTFFSNEFLKLYKSNCSNQTFLLTNYVSSIKSNPSNFSEFQKLSTLRELVLIHKDTEDIINFDLPSPPNIETIKRFVTKMRNRIKEVNVLYQKIINKVELQNVVVLKKLLQNNMNEIGHLKKFIPVLNTNFDLQDDIVIDVENINVHFNDFSEGESVEMIEIMKKLDINGKFVAFDFRELELSCIKNLRKLLQQREESAQKRCEEFCDILFQYIKKNEDWNVYHTNNEFQKFLESNYFSIDTPQFVIKQFIEIISIIIQREENNIDFVISPIMKTLHFILQISLIQQRSENILMEFSIKKKLIDLVDQVNSKFDNEYVSYQINLITECLKLTKDNSDIFGEVISTFKLFDLSDLLELTREKYELIVEGKTRFVFSSWYKELFENDLLIKSSYFSKLKFKLYSQNFYKRKLLFLLNQSYYKLDICFVDICTLFCINIIDRITILKNLWCKYNEEVKESMKKLENDEEFKELEKEWDSFQLNYVSIIPNLTPGKIFHQLIERRIETNTKKDDPENEERWNERFGVFVETFDSFKKLINFSSDFFGEEKDEIEFGKKKEIIQVDDEIDNKIHQGKFFQVETIVDLEERERKFQVEQKKVEKIKRDFVQLVEFQLKRKKILKDELKIKILFLNELQKKNKTLLLLFKEYWNTIVSCFEESEKDILQLKIVESFDKILLKMKQKKKDWNYSKSFITDEEGAAMDFINNSLLLETRYYSFGKFIDQVISASDFLDLKIDLKPQPLYSLQFKNNNYDLSEFYSIVEEKNFILLMSPSGYGKTSLCRHLCFWMSERNSEVFPLFLKAEVVSNYVKNYFSCSVEEKVKIFEEAVFYSNFDEISTTFSSVEIIELRNELMQLISSEKLMIILDGVDEVCEAKRKVFFQFLKLLFIEKNVSVNKILVNSRQGILDIPEFSSISKKFDVCSLNRLTNENTFKMIENVCRSNDIEEEKIITRFQSLNIDHGGNPLLIILLLKRLLSSDDDNDKNLNNTFDIYENILVDTIKENMKRNQNSKINDCSNSWKMNALSIIAYIIHRTGPDKSNVLRIMNKYSSFVIGNESWIKSLSNPIETIIDELVSYSGFCSLQGDFISWTHRVILEFFTARFLINIEKNTYIEKLSDVFSKNQNLYFSFSFRDEKWKKVYSFLNQMYLSPFKDVYQLLVFKKIVLDYLLKFNSVVSKEKIRSIIKFSKKNEEQLNDLFELKRIDNKFKKIEEIDKFFKKFFEISINKMISLIKYSFDYNKKDFDLICCILMSFFNFNLKKVLNYLKPQNIFPNFGNSWNKKMILKKQGRFFVMKITEKNIDYYNNAYLYFLKYDLKQPLNVHDPLQLNFIFGFNSNYIIQFNNDHYIIGDSLYKKDGTFIKKFVLNYKKYLRKIFILKEDETKILIIFCCGKGNEIILSIFKLFLKRRRIKSCETMKDIKLKQKFDLKDLTIEIFNEQQLVFYSQKILVFFNVFTANSTKISPNTVFYSKINKNLLKSINFLGSKYIFKQGKYFISFNSNIIRVFLINLNLKKLNLSLVSTFTHSSKIENIYRISNKNLIIFLDTYNNFIIFNFERSNNQIYSNHYVMIIPIMSIFNYIDVCDINLEEIKFFVLKQKVYCLYYNFVKNKSSLVCFYKKKLKNLNFQKFEYNLELFCENYQKKMNSFYSGISCVEKIKSNQFYISENKIFYFKNGGIYECRKVPFKSLEVYQLNHFLGKKIFFNSKEVIIMDYSKSKLKSVDLFLFNYKKIKSSQVKSECCEKFYLKTNVKNFDTFLRNVIRIENNLFLVKTVHKKICCFLVVLTQNKTEAVFIFKNSIDVFWKESSLNKFLVAKKFTEKKNSILIEEFNFLKIDEKKNIIGSSKPKLVISCVFQINNVMFLTENFLLINDSILYDIKKMKISLFFSTKYSQIEKMNIVSDIYVNLRNLSKIIYDSSRIYTKEESKSETLLKEIANLLRPKDQTVEVKSEIFNYSYFYHSEGIVSKVGAIIDQKLNGFGRKFNKKGEVIEEGTFRDDLLVTGKQFHDNSLRVRYQGDFDEGERHGVGKLYYFSGQLEYEGQFEEDEINGLGKMYYQNGVLMYKGNFKNGFFHGDGMLYNGDKQLFAQGTFEYSFIKLKDDLYRNFYLPCGKVKYIGSMFKGKFQGQGKYYFENGKLKFVGIFNNNKMTTGKYYHESGFIKYIVEGKFDEKGFTGRWRQFDEEKQIVFDSEFEDNSLKKGKLYENGKIKFDGHFDEKIIQKAHFFYENNVVKYKAISDDMLKT